MTQDTNTLFTLKGEYIALDQLLKVLGWVGSGGEAHAAVEAGRVWVDGQCEKRKRAKIRPGQRVRMEGEEVRVQGA